MLLRPDKGYQDNKYSLNGFVPLFRTTLSAQLNTCFHWVERVQVTSV